MICSAALEDGTLAHIIVNLCRHLSVFPSTIWHGSLTLRFPTTENNNHHLVLIRTMLKGIQSKENYWVLGSSSDQHGGLTGMWSRRGSQLSMGILPQHSGMLHLWARVGTSKSQGPTEFPHTKSSTLRCWVIPFPFSYQCFSQMPSAQLALSTLSKNWLNE